MYVFPKYFSKSMDSIFILLTLSFLEQKFLILKQSSLSFFLLYFVLFES